MSTIKESSGPSGWDVNAICDNRGVAILIALLTQKDDGRVFPDFNVNDKIPNFDGRLLVGSLAPNGKRFEPCCTYEVQIKSTHKIDGPRKQGSHKGLCSIRCDGSSLEAVNRRISLNPAILFFVDIV